MGEGDPLLAGDELRVLLAEHVPYLRAMKGELPVLEVLRIEHHGADVRVVVADTANDTTLVILPAQGMDPSTSLSSFLGAVYAPYN